ncbi:DNA adenine methylase [Schaedlerella arabinosiphila]|uniref:DNA adenine methylase n=1 Tax=Schaedlerella arabinosiphila TaxID=2044587 RepID=UPI00255830E9|nr:DNA adenine methylase [Schaedlerella arabinosiphila]
MVRSVLHYPGGKKRIASWIIRHMPPHHSYLEPYFGCGAVLFAKEPAPIETVNDLDGEVVNFFMVIRDPESREKLQERITYTPYARQVYDEAVREDSEDPVERDACFAKKSMMSHGFRMNGDCGWKKDVYGRENAYAVKYWNELPESIAEMAVRLKQVQIENRQALDLIKDYDYENVLMYLDPPYVWSTRGGRKQYRHEMTDQDHIELLEAVTGRKAKIMISGYDCELYDFYLGNWKKLQVAARAQDNRRRTETLWMNYDLEDVQLTLQI